MTLVVLLRGNQIMKVVLACLLVSVAALAPSAIFGLM
jgi:hypothetical protein